MTLAFTCDGPGCTRTLSSDDARVELNEVDAIAPLPVSDEDGMTEFVGVTTLRVGADACDRHFCGLACLAAWAMRTDIDRTTP